MVEIFANVILVSRNRNTLNSILGKSLCNIIFCPVFLCHLSNKQLPAMHWSNGERILDIGCGSGDVTRFILILIKLTLILIKFILISAK